MSTLGGRGRLSTHLVDLLVLHPLLEAPEHSTELCPEEYSDDDDHHRDCDLPEKDIRSSLDGPHEVEVHTLGQRYRLDRQERREKGERGTNEVTGEQGQRHEQDGGNSQRPHDLVHLVRRHLCKQHAVRTRAR